VTDIPVTGTTNNIDTDAATTDVPDITYDDDTTRRRTV
jgi:hypothetical protein